jgi:ribosomal protein L20A (L18A)
LKQDRDIIHQDAERWRKIAAQWKARHDEIHIANVESIHPESKP